MARLYFSFVLFYFILFVKGQRGKIRGRRYVISIIYQKDQIYFNFKKMQKLKELYYMKRYNIR